MKIENLSMKKSLWLITVGLLATSFLVLLGLFLVTKNLRVVLYGGLLTAVFLIWGGIFLHYFQKKLTLFTDSLCRTLDDMMDSAVRSEIFRAACSAPESVSSGTLGPLPHSFSATK